MPTPTIAMEANLAHLGLHALTAHIQIVLTEPGVGVQQHRRLLTLLRRIVIEPAVRGLLVHRPPTGDGAGETTLTGQRALLGPLAVVVALGRIHRRDERLRVHQSDQTRHVPEPEAGDQTGLERELPAQVERLARPDEVTRGGQLVVDAVQAAGSGGMMPSREDPGLQTHHLEHRRTALGMPGQVSSG